jgi:hypothetical protein
MQHFPPAMVKLIIILSPSVPPTASIQPKTNSVFIEDSASYRCVTTGTVPNTVVWSRTGHQTLPNGVVQNGNLLIIEEARQNHTGEYECTVSNSAGSSSDNFVLTVRSE